MKLPMNFQTRTDVSNVPALSERGLHTEAWSYVLHLVFWGVLLQRILAKVPEKLHFKLLPVEHNLSQCDSHVLP